METKQPTALKLMNCQAEKFTLPEGLSYFNTAYMSPLLKEVRDRGMAGLRKKENPRRYSMDEFFGDVEQLRTTFGRLIHAPAKQIAVIPAVSYGMANAAQNISYKKDGEIICVEEQFPSNYYPWEMAAKSNNQRLKLIKAGLEAQTRVRQWNENILSAIGERTTAVCMPHVHWADGSLFDLKSISQACKQHSAYLIIDGTQSVGALPLYLDEIPFDVLVVGGYKWLLGHYGLGLAYYSSEFNDGSPIEDNWINKENSEDFTGLVNYKDRYKEGAARYSVGEQSNFVHVPMLQAGLEQILEWGLEQIQHYCQRLHQVLIEGLKGTDYQVQLQHQSSSHLTGIRIAEDMNMDLIKQTLDQQDIFVSYRGDAIRVSFYVFNTEQQVLKFVRVLKELYSK